MMVKTTANEAENKPIKVLIVDNAAFMRSAIFKMIECDPQIEVVGTACNGQEALEMIDKLQPDVVTLDVDMPVMDGITCTRHIMIESPVPVVILSSLFNDGAITFDALRLGVVDFIPKPSGAVSTDIERSRQHLIDRIKLASAVNLDNIRRVRLPLHDVNKDIDRYGYQPLDYILALGTTLSGPNAIIRLLANLSPALPTAIVVVVEISPEILSAFIERLDMAIPWEIYKAEDGIQLKQGACYISSYQEGVLLQSGPDGTICLTKGEDENEPLNQLFVSAA
ncbi:MAG: response regulator, partial [Deltaproteobacteria bacterium]|nr:response regulator [Deltaproteobacteria bacterium]